MPAKWGLLTNHARVLIHVVENPRSTVRGIADSVGLTERAVGSLLRALEADAIVVRKKVGRSNEYAVNIDALMAHRSHGTYTISQIANGMLALAGRVPGFELPPGMNIARGDAPRSPEPAVAPAAAGPVAAENVRL
jgi:DNA-binding Lrp family transcriptional regulator